MTTPPAGNAPSELELLRRVAAAAVWVIESNGDDVVGRDGRGRFGINAIMANGQLASALKDLQFHYEVENSFAEERENAARLAAKLREKP